MNIKKLDRLIEKAMDEAFTGDDFEDKYLVEFEDGGVTKSFHQKGYDIYFGDEKIGTTDGTFDETGYTIEMYCNEKLHREIKDITDGNGVSIVWDEIQESEEDKTETFIGTITEIEPNKYNLKFDDLDKEFEIEKAEDEPLEAALQNDDWVDEAIDDLEFAVNSLQIHLQGNKVELTVEYDIDEDEEY